MVVQRLHYVKIKIRRSPALHGRRDERPSVLAWNTNRMDGVVARLKRDDVGVVEDWLRRIGPAHFSHINFRGTFRFNVERYADVLVERAVGRGATKPGQ